MNQLTTKLIVKSDPEIHTSLLALSKKRGLPLLLKLPSIFDG